MAFSPAHASLSGLNKVFYDGRQPLSALADISFDVGWGEFVSIIGPSGCGKSTLLRIIGGLLAPSTGRVEIGGRNPREVQAAREIGFVFQDPALLPWRDVLANVGLPLQVDRLPQRRRHEPEDLLDLVDLREFAHYYPHQLSGGMQQRVALARALVFSPSLLLMDEPFGALDEITRSSLRYELLRIWDATKKTVLFVTHSIVEAVILSDRVVALSARPGRVQAIIDIDLPRPRREEMERSPAFLDYASRLRSLLKEVKA
jgi:NitT/TauT family transport system ATP-binding protein